MSRLIARESIFPREVEPDSITLTRRSQRVAKDKFIGRKTAALRGSADVIVTQVGFTRKKIRVLTHGLNYTAKEAAAATRLRAFARASS